MYSVERKLNKVIIKDKPYGIWAFFSLFIIVGSLMLYVVLMKSPNQHTFIIGLFITMMIILVAALMLKKEPASIFEIDILKKKLTITRWGIFSRSISQLDYFDSSHASIEVTDHSEGGKIYRPQFVIHNESTIPISFSWCASQDKVQAAINSINKYLKKP